MKLSLGIGLGVSGSAIAAPPSEIILEDVAVDELYIPAADNCYVERGTPTTLAEVDDLVGQIVNAAGSGNFEALSDSDRGNLKRDANGYYFLERTALGDTYRAGSLSTNSTFGVAFAYNASGSTKLTPLHVFTATRHAFAMIDADASSPFAFCTGEAWTASDTTTSVAGTRDAYFDAFGVGKTLFIGNFTTDGDAAWIGVQRYGYPNQPSNGAHAPIRLYGSARKNSAWTAAERAVLATQFARLIA